MKITAKNLLNPCVGGGDGSGEHAWEDGGGHVQASSVSLQDVSEFLGPVLRIRDVYPGSWFLPIPDPETATKKRGEKNKKINKNKIHDSVR